MLWAVVMVVVVLAGLRVLRVEFGFVLLLVPLTVALLLHSDGAADDGRADEDVEHHDGLCCFRAGLGLGCSCRVSVDTRD